MRQHGKKTVALRLHSSKNLYIGVAQLFKKTIEKVTEDFR